ncbi:C40 family peptidase [Pedobacter steynii]
MEQYYGICRVAVAPLRSEPSDRAEIASQLLFGDHVEIISKTEKWWQVRNAYDGYEGWMDFKQLTEVSLDEYTSNHNCKYLAPAEIVNIITDTEGSKYYLSPGSNLPSFNNGYCSIGNEKYKVLFNPKVVSGTEPTDIINTALFFQNVAYLWGGKNLFGMDCSGFAQIVFKLHGIQLNRDAWQQAEQGEIVDFLPEVKPGDVAFFDNENGRIIHVGIMLNATDIIHASGKVRIDPMDNQGIYNAELGRYSHKLRIVKRLT